MATAQQVGTDVRRRPLLVVVQVLLVLAVAAGAWVLSHRIPYPSYKDWFDLRVYQGAAQWWTEGNPLYSFDYDNSGYGFTYPPFAAVVFAPLAALGFGAAAAVHTTLNVVLAGLLTAWLAVPIARRMGWSPWFAVGLALPVVLSIEPVRETLGFGQVNLVLGALIAVDVIALRRGWAWAGVGTGLAVAIKLTPAVLVLWFLLTRQWRAAGISAGTAVLASLLAFVVSPATSTQFWGTTLFETGRVGELDQISNQSLMGAVARIAHPGEPSQALWALLVLATLVVGMYRAVRAHREGDLVVAVTLVGLVSCLISPVSWTHHLYWLVPALAVLVDVALGAAVAGPALGGRPRVVTWLSGLTVLVATPALCVGTLWYFGDPGKNQPHQTSLIGGLGEDSYVLLMVGLLLWLPVRAAVRTPAASSRSSADVLAVA
jgi:alpha-1,2-mannosyltransferase